MWSGRYQVADTPHPRDHAFISTAGAVAFRPGWDGPTGLGRPDGTAAFIPPIPVFANNPGNQTTPVNSPASLTLTGGGGFTPYAWTSTACRPACH